MISQLSDFLNEYNSFNQVLVEYNKGYAAMQNVFAGKTQTSNMQILSELQRLESNYHQQNQLLLHRVQVQLDKLKRILYIVDTQEKAIKEKRFLKFKKNASNDNTDSTFSGIHFKEDEIEKQVSEAVSAIEKLTKSKMPKSLAAICGFFNPNFRKKTYKRIVENKKQLEQMIAVAERDVNQVFEDLKQEIEEDISTKVSGLSSKKIQSRMVIEQEKSSFLAQLHKLLLDGIEIEVNSGSVYNDAKSDLTEYLTCYSQGGIDRISTDKLFLGILNQQVSQIDDGTLSTVLSSVFGESIYSNHSLLIPLRLNRAFVKPVCINYFSEYNDNVFTLFKNYALQMLNLFSDVGVSVYLVDCTNMGSKYSDFTSFESQDKNKRVNIIRTTDAFESTLTEMADYIIETNSDYLKNLYSNVIDYNHTAVMKREIKVLFISNISEVSSTDLLSKVTTIVRNGNRCGVYCFLGISSDELQVSGIVSQLRVSAVNEVVGLCDKICMNSNGELSLGNGTFQFFSPPTVEQRTEQFIIQRAVLSERQSALVKLQEHFINDNIYHTFECNNNIVIPIGVDAQGNEYTLDFNRDAAYMLVGGDPSSGKSSLMHTIILQAISRYSPEVLQLYLADLKDGVEFDNYIRKGIKSVKAVLNDASDDDMTTSFLEYIKSLVEERTNVFKEVSDMSGQLVRNIEQFYEVNNTAHIVPNIPRILLIIDEFQSLYDNGRDTGDITNWLVRMCRTVGINIIMASQRAQSDSITVNSFTGQTKDYFVYRMMFKCPYSSARQIVPEQCSDTGQSNTAVRKAQTLKKGQAIVNPNMGATEADNMIIQCYYPDNACIDTICDKVVSNAGCESVIVLNSEASIILDQNHYLNADYFVLGASNRLHYDRYNKNSDVFIDDIDVAIRAESCMKVMCVGTDDRVRSCAFWVFLAKLVKMHRSNLRVNILIRDEDCHKFNGFNSIPKGTIHSTSQVKEYIDYSKNVTDDIVLFNVIYNPYVFNELQKEEWATSQTETVTSLLSIFSRDNTLHLLIAEDAKKTKEKCSYLDSEFRNRIISVGNTVTIKQAISADLWDKITDCGFNVIRSNVIKAYYYNKSTDKLGRFRMFDINDLISCVDFFCLNSDSNDEESGYSGLVGN